MNYYSVDVLVAMTAVMCAVSAALLTIGFMGVKTDRKVKAMGPPAPPILLLTCDEYLVHKTKGEIENRSNRTICFASHLSFEDALASIRNYQQAFRKKYYRQDTRSGTIVEFRLLSAVHLRSQATIATLEGADVTWVDSNYADTLQEG